MNIKRVAALILVSVVFIPACLVSIPMFLMCAIEKISEWTISTLDEWKSERQKKEKYDPRIEKSK
jgi:hypothetical protein